MRRVASTERLTLRWIIPLRLVLPDHVQASVAGFNPALGPENDLVLPGLFFIDVADGIAGFGGKAVPEVLPVELGGFAAPPKQSKKIISIGNWHGLNPGDSARVGPHDL